MPNPQSAIFREDSTHHYFLEYVLRGGTDRAARAGLLGRALAVPGAGRDLGGAFGGNAWSCLLYTSDAAGERSSVDLGCRRFI